METEEKYLLKGDELLIAVFAHFPKNEPLRLETSSSIVKAFYKISKKEKYDELFTNYKFDTDGVIVQSRDIEGGLDIIERSQLLNKEGSKSSFYYLTRGIDIRFSKFIVPKLSDRQKELLIALSKEILEELLPQ